jgi:hypothetical protein
MHTRLLVRLAAGGMALFSLLELVSTGCGILSAPISVPAAIAANDSPGLSGTIVDDLGRPLNGVHIHVSTRHVEWEPLFGQQDRYHDSEVVADDSFVIPPERGASMALSFERAGYRGRTITVMATKMEQKADGQALGTWPRQKRVTVVMERVDAVFPRLIHADQSVAYPAGTGFRGIDLEHPEALYVGASPAAHLFYATLEGFDPPPSNMLPDPPDRDLPKRMTFHLSDPDGGFVAYVPHFGQDVLGQMTEAPAAGYVPTLTLERRQLQKMRGWEEKETDLRLLFYFRAGGRFGKGMIAWDRRYVGNTYSAPLNLRYVLLMQPQAGDRDVRSSEAAPH